MQFPGARGKISAAVFGAGQVGVVVSNTIVGRACDWLPWARELATQGYRVMLFDYSALVPTTDIPTAADLFASDTVQAAASSRSWAFRRWCSLVAPSGAWARYAQGWTTKPTPAGSSACRQLARTRSRNPCGCWRSLSRSWQPTTTFVPSRWRMSCTVPLPVPRAASLSYSRARSTPISCYNPPRQRSRGYRTRFSANRRMSPTLDWQPGCAGRADAVEVHERGGGDEFSELLVRGLLG
jgi:hypothetical protein